MPKLSAIDHVVLTVGDIDTTVAFYRDVLGMAMQTFAAADGSRRTALTFGAQKINLHPADRPSDPKAARPTPGSADLCLLTEDPLADWQAHVARAGVAIIEGPVRRTGATGPILSIYVRDPDGNLIEVSVSDQRA